MIHNLYSISEGGVAIYSKNFAKSTMDEQLISGFLIALGYLGGLLRDQKRLYPVPSGQQVKASGKS